MGTNYYHHDEKPPCPTCGHSPESPRHIGKSSAGWVFALHVYPEDGINDLEDWIARWSSGFIEDEYGNKLTPDEMRRCITHRPHGTLRAPLDKWHVIGHGEGSWDLHIGDFS